MAAAERNQKMHERAALYVLGPMSAEEMQQFEDELRAGREEALSALRALADTTAELAVSQQTSKPPESLKSRLMERVVGGDPPAAPGRGKLGAIRSNEGKWRQSEFAGIQYKVLFFDRAAGLVTTLVRMEPGASLPAHVHGKPEQCLVVEGDLWHEGHEYGPGDFTWAEAGSLDPEIRTKNGNLLLIVGAPETEYVKP